MPSFRYFAPRSLALVTSVLFASLGVAGCGQEGIVGASSTGDSTSGSGGTGGTGGASSSGTAGSDTGGAETPMRLKVLNWNLHNFFDQKKDTAEDAEFVLTKSQYDEKVIQVGAVLKEMEPDIAILPEIENKAILDDINTKQLGGAYQTAITETNDFRGLDIGILTKVPIVDVVTHVDDSFKRLDLLGGQSYKFSRDAVEIHLNFNTREIVLLGVHYRSKGDGSAETDDKDKRMAEAQHTRAIADAILKEKPKTAILILGDFNDLPGSPPLIWSLSGDPENSPKVPFFASADAVAESDRYSFVFEGNKELIDHQLMNKVLQPMLDTSSVVIRHENDVEDASDHHPMMATYNIQ